MTNMINDMINNDAPITHYNSIIYKLTIAIILFMNINYI